jgi:hypothetical protein
MVKRKREKDKTISTKYHKKANFEQQKAFILSTLKYIRGMWALW